MTSRKHDLDRIAWVDGVDVTHLAGSHEAALERLIEAKLAVEQNPNIANCRAYVAAHDAFWGMVQDVARAA